MNLLSLNLKSLSKPIPDENNFETPRLSTDTVKYTLPDDTEVSQKKREAPAAVQEEEKAIEPILKSTSRREKMTSSFKSSSSSTGYNQSFAFDPTSQQAAGDGATTRMPVNSQVEVSATAILE